VSPYNKAPVLVLLPAVLVLPIRPPPPLVVPLVTRPPRLLESLLMPLDLLLLMVPMLPELEPRRKAVIAKLMAALLLPVPLHRKLKATVLVLVLVPAELLLPIPIRLSPPPMVPLVTRLPRRLEALLMPPLL